MEIKKNHFNNYQSDKVAKRLTKHSYLTSEESSSANLNKALNILIKHFD